MIIESKPMLELQIRSFQLYVEKLQQERDTLFHDPLDPEQKLLDINFEIDVANSIIDAAQNELKNKH